MQCFQFTLWCVYQYYKIPVSNKQWWILMNGTLQFSIHWTTSFRYDLWSYSIQILMWLIMFCVIQITNQTNWLATKCMVDQDWLMSFWTPKSKEHLSQLLLSLMRASLSFCALLWTFIFLHTSEIIHKLWCILGSAFKIINNDNNNELHYDINLVTLYFKMSATRYMYLLL